MNKRQGYRNNTHHEMAIVGNTAVRHRSLERNRHRKCIVVAFCSTRCMYMDTFHALQYTSYLRILLVVVGRTHTAPPVVWRRQCTRNGDRAETSSRASPGLQGCVPHRLTNSCRGIIAAPEDPDAEASACFPSSQGTDRGTVQ